MTTHSTCRSLNVLALDDTLWCSLYGWNGDREKYPETAFLVRVAGFVPSPLTREEWVHVEAVKRSDMPGVDNDWQVPFGWLRRERGV